MRVCTVDAFARERFSGNPAAVVVLAKALSQETMQLIAREMALSETAFVVPQEKSDSGDDDGVSVFSLRWFTPETEVRLCGHATLASAHILFTEDNQDELGEATQHALRENGAVHFETLSGRLTVHRCRGDTGDFINRLRLNFPRGDAAAGLELSDIVLSGLVRHVLGLSEADAARPRDFIHDVAFCPKTRKLIVHVKEPRLAVNCKPDGAGMMAIDFGTLEVRGICATADTSADSDGEYAEFDFVSRYFAPWVGIPEDPVTGSLHTVLAPFWAQHGEKRGSVDTLVGLQASPRGGIVYCTLPADLPDRVFLEGSAVTVMRGDFV